MLTVLTNKVNNLTVDQANKVISYVDKTNRELIDKARQSCGETDSVDCTILYSANTIYIKVECGDYRDEKRTAVSDILNCSSV
jgi:hypothetical protein